MMFIALSRIRSGTEKERVRRRAQWNPEGQGAHFIAEYWLPTSDPNVISVFEADDPTVIFTAMAEWDDVFDIEVYPAVTSEQGLKALAGRETGAAEGPRPSPH